MSPELFFARSILKERKYSEMLRNLYLKTLKVAEKKSANYFLAFISFIESSIFPIPPDVLIIPMILAKPHRAFKIAAIATISSVIGGMFGYFIGLFLWNEIGESILNAYHLTENFQIIKDKYTEIGNLAVLIASITPFPYKVITLFSGFVEMNLMSFLLISIIGRGFRFFLIAGILYYLGEKAKYFIEKYLTLSAIIFL